jgi:hypothetical protein
MGPPVAGDALSDLVRGVAESQRDREANQQAIGRGVQDFLGPHLARALSGAPGVKSGIAEAMGAQPEGGGAGLEADQGLDYGPALQFSGSRSTRAPMPPGLDLSGFNREVENLRSMRAGMPSQAKAQAQGLDEAFGSARKAQGGLVEQQAKTADEIAGLMDIAQGAQAEVAARNQARQEDAKAKVGQRLDSFDQAVRAAGAASIDPDRWYKDKDGNTFGRRLGSAVAVALGSIGAAFGKHENTAMKLIEDAIGRDLMAQRVEIGNRQDAVKNATNSVGLARQNFLDTVAQGEAEMAAEYARAQGLVKTAIAKSSSAEYRAKGEALLADLEVKRQEAMSNAAQSEFGREWKASEVLAGLEAKGAAAKQANELQTYRAQFGGQGGGGGLRGLVPIDPQNPPSKAELKAAQVQHAKYERAVSAVSRALQIRKSSGWKLKTPREQKAILKDAASALADYRGVSAEAKIKALQNPEAVGLPSDLGEIGSVQEQLTSVLQGLRSDHEANMGAAGGGGLALDDAQNLATQSGWKKVR